MAPYIKLNKLNMENVPGSEVNLSVEKGEVIAITGLNGCGKSTLAKYLAGITRPDSIGKIIINGMDSYSQLDNDKIRRVVGFVFQDPRTGRVFENIGRDIVFGTENIGMDKDKIVKRFTYFMQNYGMKRKQSKYYSTVSVSEQQRAALFATLMMPSDVLILDEPFSMQSSINSKRYFDVIIRNARKRSQTVVIFSKQKYILESVDRAYQLIDGRIYEIDTAGMQESISDATLISEDRGKFIDHNRKIRVERYINGGDNKGENGLSLHNISFGYDDELIIDGINARFEAGSAYRIMGPSGSGKSTYLQLIGGLLKPYEGEIFIGETSKVGYVFQYSEDGFVENTVLDDVMFGPMSAGYSKREARVMATQVLQFVGVNESLWSRSPLKLSMGEQRLVSIAGALALSPDFLLIDEPFQGLDQNSRKHMEDIIAALCSEGKCVVIVE